MAIPTQKDKDQRYAPYAGGGGLASSSSSSSFSGCRLSQSAGQSIDHNTTTLMTYDTEDYDTDGYHSAGAPSKLIAPTTGKYLLEVTAAINTTLNSGFLYLEIKKNGTTRQIYQAAGNAGAGGSATAGNCINLSIVVAASANDYFEVNCFQNSGGALSVVGSDPPSSFSMTRL